MVSAEEFFAQNAVAGPSLPMDDGSEMFPESVRWAGPGMPEVVAVYALPDGRTLERWIGLERREAWRVAGELALRAGPEIDLEPSRSMN